MKRVHLKGITGSSDAFITHAVTSNIGGNHLLVLSDKEEAAYFYNNLENIINNERGTTLLFYPVHLKALSNRRNRQCKYHSKN